LGWGERRQLALVVRAGTAYEDEKKNKHKETFAE
jgi:hypothetical protein